MLYKVSPPREGMRFDPMPFWRSADWKSSSSRPRTGYVEDCVLYAGDFDEINIHLLPKVRRLRVWVNSASIAVLNSMGITPLKDSKAVIIAHTKDREAIFAFQPTIYAFAPGGFQRVPSNEFISHEPREAVSCETISMPEAIRRWRILLVFRDDLDACLEHFRQHELKYSEQT